MLPSYDLVFNAIGDQDATEATEEPVDRFLCGCDKSVLNLPSAVARTRRDLMPALFAPIVNVLTPLNVRLRTEYFKEQLLTLSGIRMPVLVHPEYKHDILQYKNPYVQRIFDAFDALLTRRASGNLS